jgi:hypothetical protein
VQYGWKLNACANHKKKSKFFKKPDVIYHFLVLIPF